MTARSLPRVLVVVCDSWGVGDAPDAADYGDEASDTLANTADAVGGIRAPNLASLGLGSLTGIRGVDAAPTPEPLTVARPSAPPARTPRRVTGR